MTPEHEQPADAAPDEGAEDGPQPEEPVAGEEAREADLVTGEGVNEGAAEMVEESPEADEDHAG